MMYYVYMITSLVSDLIITMENCLVKSLHDIWKPVFMFPLLFAGCVALHCIAISAISLFADKTKKWLNIENIYRKVTLETIDLLLHIMKIRLHVTGCEKLPEDERFLLVGNHISIFDPMIAMLTFQDKKLAFVSKKENIEIPFGGRLMLASGCLPLDRENNRAAIKTIKEASSRISENHYSMGIYPEGGINKSDDVLLPFHSGSFKIAKKSGAPIAVATIRNAELAKKRFLFAPTDVYFDVIRIVEPEEYSSMNTSEISNMVWTEMYEYLCDKYSPTPEADIENQEAAC